MATPQCIVRYQLHDRTLTFRVEGRATMTEGLPVRKFAEKAQEAGIEALAIDLQACTYMDSTFLGTLLTLRKNQERLHGEFALIAPSLACARILQGMGVSDLFLTRPDAAAEEAWHELPLVIPDPHLHRRNIVEAHEELASLPGQAGEQFEAVLRCINQAGKPTPPDGKTGG